MSDNDHTPGGRPTPAELIRRGWGWTLAFGIILVLLGSIGLITAATVTLASVLLFGSLLAAAAVLHLIEAFRKPDHRRGSRLENGLLALLYLAMAATIYIDPLSASLGLTLVLAGLFAAIGIMRLAYAWQRREQRTEALLHLLGGVANLAITALIIIYWPFSGFWVIGTLISIELLMNGWLLVFAALVLRRLIRRAATGGERHG